MLVLSSNVLRSTQVFMAVIEKYKTRGDTSSASSVDVLYGKFFCL